MRRNIQYYMRIHNLSERRLAMEAGIGLATISRFLNSKNRKGCSLETLDKILTYTGLTYAQLCYQNLEEEERDGRRFYRTRDN